MQRKIFWSGDFVRYAAMLPKSIVGNKIPPYIRRRMRKNFLQSLFLHFVLLAAIVIWRPLPHVSPPAAVFVDLPTPAPNETQSATGSASSSAPESALRSAPNNRKPKEIAAFSPNPQALGQQVKKFAQPLQHGKSFRELAPSAGPQTFSPGKESDSVDSRGWPTISASDKDATHSYFQSLTLQKEGKLSPLAQKILKRVDSYVGYPPDFIEENFAGEVVIQFLVSPEGKFLRFLHVDGEQKALTLYSMAMVILALNREIANLPKDRPASNIPISLALSYRLLLPDEISNRREPAAYKNSLQLERVAFTEPRAIKKARRAIEKYTPPIVPVPGGFFVDFVALYKRFAETGSDDPDWEREARMLLDRETLEVFLKSQS
jgi:hypothetical protein